MKTRSAIVLFTIAVVVVIGACASTLEPGDNETKLDVAAGDWPHWRGATRDGVATDESAPMKWSETENIRWKVEVPGRGHASPTVVGNRVLLATADEKKKVQSVLAFDRATGRKLWQTDLHSGGFDGKTHKRNTHASSTLACDGERIYATFMNAGVVWVTALDMDGKQLWQTDLGDFTSHWGYTTSPALYKSSLLVAADHKGGGYLASLDRATGDVKWKTERPKLPSYCSPVVYHIGGRDQLLIAGCKLVASYDPNTGKQLWSTAGTTEECVGMAVISGETVIVSGGWPKHETICVKADGSGKVLWKNKVKVYVPSLLTHQGYVYAVTDNGIAYCWNAKTGEEAWSERIGGTINTSPVLVGEQIYITAENGRTTIFKASPTAFSKLSENQLGSEVFATPTICGGQIFMRVADRTSAGRVETLYCIDGE
ncbi:MAG: PQQ-binding-like beta-propeller repeat protein [Planctomycetes bacterium]|nr:PQQ-binding-like beta-propeller repeat protein [Planctomycetota bacterium]